MNAFFNFKFGKKPPKKVPEANTDKEKQAESMPGSDQTHDQPILPPELGQERKSESADKELKRKTELLLGKKSRGNRLLPRFIIILLVILIIAALAVKVGPRYGFDITQTIEKMGITKVMDKIGMTKLMEKMGIKKPQPMDTITPEEEAVEELVTVRTYRVARGDFVDILPSMGTIKGDREIELRFAVNGVIDSINFYEGDILRKGDIVATLDQKDALLKLEYAKSKLSTQEVAELTAKKKLEIHQTLYDDGIIIAPKLEEIRLEYENAKTQVKTAQKEVEFALAELDKTYLYSPINAVMGTRDVEIGEFVNSNVKAASVYDVSTVIAEVGIIEKDISRMALGQKAKVNVDTYPGVDFEGKIDSIAPIIEGKSRTLTVKVKIKNDNPKGTLLPGMFARVWISVYEKKNTIKVPSACLYDLDNNGEFESVYAVSEENIANVRPVKIGYISTDFVEIVDGLKEGEQVVSESMAELKDGVKVDIIEVQEAAF